MTDEPPAKVTWLTPYMEAWATYQGAISPGRLAKCVKPSYELLGAADAAGFLAFVQSARTVKPEWYAANCKQWVEKGQQLQMPLVSETGLLTSRGRRVYAGGE